MDWTKCEIMTSATYFAMMASATNPLHATEGDIEIWDDVEVLRLLQTHKYSNGLSAKTRDHKRARCYRWIGDNLFIFLRRRALVVVKGCKSPSTCIGAWATLECSESWTGSERTIGGGAWVTRWQQSSRPICFEPG